MELKTNHNAGSATESRHVKVLVIGAGPAGLSAAMYAARADLEPVVLTGMTMGGQVALTHIVENYPGFPDGLSGDELGNLLKQHAERFGAEVIFDTATDVDLSARPYKVTTYGGAFTADAVVIATGATPRHLEVPGEEEFTGRGVSYCGTCDGFFFKDKKVVVVGGGDSALEEGGFLTRFATDVNIIHRRDEFRASQILQNRATANEKIDVTWDTVVKSIEGGDQVEKVVLENINTGETSEYATDGVFIFIGHTPNTEMFAGQLEMDDHGYLITHNWVETSLPGVYAAGEVADSIYRQVVTSAGMGAAAAIAATRYLEGLEDQAEEAAETA